MAANPVEFLSILLYILPFLQYFVFFVFMLTFGRIAIFGYRTHSPWYVKVLVFFGTGLFSLFCGISLSGILLSGTDPITSLMRILMLDVFVSGLLCSVIIAVGVFLVSRNLYNVKGIERSIEDLQERIKKAQNAAKTPLVKRIVGPTMIAGIVILLGILAYSAMNFQGIPSYTDRISSAIGIPLDEIQGLLGSAGDFLGPLGGTDGGDRPEGCVGLSSLFFSHANEIMGGELTEYVNPTVKEMIESSSGSSVQVMFSVDEGGSDYAVAITDDNKVCSAKVDGSTATFCECMELALPF